MKPILSRLESQASKIADSLALANGVYIANWHQAFSEAFASLIISKCVRICADLSKTYETAHHCSLEIQKVFGPVKEDKE